MEQSFFKRPTFWYGIYYGLTSIVVFIFQYFLTRESLLNSTVSGIISLIVMVTFMVLIGLKERSENGGHITYGNALKSMFLTAFTGIIIFTAFSYVFNNYYAPEYMTEIFEKQIQETREKLEENPNMTEEQIDKSLETMKWAFDKKNSIFFQFMGLLIFGFFDLVVAAITALFIKRNVPNGFSQNGIIDSDV